MRPLFTIAFVFFACAMHTMAQVRVMPNTLFTIDPATVVDFTNVAGSFTIDAGAAVTNNGTVRLGAQVNLSEQRGFPINGNGFEQADTSFTGVFTQYTGGNMGLTLTGNNTGNISIKRYHTALTSAATGLQSVKRYFEISTANYPATYTAARMAADTTELNGHTMDSLLVFGQINPAAPFQNIGGAMVNDTAVVSQPFDSITVITLMPYGLSLDSIVAQGVCPGDSIRFYYHAYGENNPLVYYALELSTSTGFGTLVYTDSSQLTGGVLTYVVPADQAINETLYARMVNTFNGIVSQPYDSVEVRTYPAVSILAQNTFCLDAGDDNATGIPAGGIFSGSIVDAGGAIHPGAAGAGSFNIYYAYTDGFGCTNTDTLEITVFPLPLTPTISNSINLLTCNQAGYTYQWYYNGSPITGETAVTHTGTQDGQYQVSITDANGCTSLSDSFNLIFTGISEIPAGQQAHIFPNPAQDYVVIEAADEIQKIMVHDASGKQIVFTPSPARTQRINTGELARGIYVFTVYTNTHTQSIRVDIIR